MNLNTPEILSAWRTAIRNVERGTDTPFFLETSPETDLEALFKRMEALSTRMYGWNSDDMTHQGGSPTWDFMKGHP
jgi:hypothetical protein